MTESGIWDRNVGGAGRVLSNGSTGRGWMQARRVAGALRGGVLQRLLRQGGREAIGSAAGRLRRPCRLSSVVEQLIRNQ